MDALGAALVIAVLLALNAALAGTEMALVSLREGQLQRLEQSAGPGRTVAALCREPNRFLAAIQVAATLVGFLAAATAAVAYSDPLARNLTVLGPAAEPFAVVMVTVALTAVTLVLGELAPKRIGLQRPEAWAVRAARPLELWARFARPVVQLLSAATDLAVRLAGADPRRHRPTIGHVELGEIVADPQIPADAERPILLAALQLGGRTLRQVMVPRRHVVAVAADEPAASAVDLLRSTGHSRAPVVDPDLDHFVGVVHLRDLIAVDGPAGPRARPGLALPESVEVIPALRIMQHQREQLALVVDEHGAAQGIVTVEDLVEQLVGEIHDETDAEISEHWKLTRHEPDGSMIVPGTLPVHVLGRLGVQLPSGPYATVAGLVLDRLGTIPERPGDRLAVGDWVVEVLEVRRRAITRLRISPDGHGGR
jgi:putative hemolysin